MTFAQMTILAAAAALSLAGYAALASGDEIALSDTDQHKISAALSADGYLLTKSEREDGQFEVQAQKDGVIYELLLDDGFNIIRVEQDD